MATTQRVVDRTILTLAVVGSLVLLNVIGIGLFARLDLTKDKEFTLSKATKDTLGALSDPISVRAYFTKDLPPPYSATTRYVRDLLEEYFAAGHHNLNYEFVDPTSEETEADAAKKKEVSHDIFGREVRGETSVEKELRDLGIPSVQIRVNEGDKVETKRGYLGIVVRYGDKHEVIPVVQDTAGLEYNLTTAIRKLTSEKSSKIAFIGGHDGPDPHKDLGKFVGAVSQLHEVTVLDLKDKTEIPDDIAAIVVVAPKTAFSEQEQKAIDKFVMAGKSAAFLLGAVIPDFKTMQTTPIDSGLGPMLETWGIKEDPGLVLDAECATINVAQQQGFMRIQQPVHYPFMPTPKSLNPKHPLTRGLTEVTFPFMSEVKPMVASNADVKVDEIVRSSAKSWIQAPPFNLDPFQRWTTDSISAQSEHPLIVTLEGKLTSHYGNPQVTNSRVLVAGGYAFVGDDFFSKGNEALAMNLIDWLVQDDALLAVRTRGLSAAPLGEISDGSRNGLKFANILGLPLLLVAFGLVRWRMREGRRTTASF